MIFFVKSFSWFSILISKGKLFLFDDVSKLLKENESSKFPSLSKWSISNLPFWPLRVNEEYVEIVLVSILNFIL